MAKIIKSAAKVDRTEIQCDKCGCVTVLISSKDKSWDGFLKPGCWHSSHLLASLLLENELMARKVRKKKAIRVSGNPGAGKRKPSARRV